jgi:cobalt-zinc-cadmium efflux system membrane fusion protein
MTSSRTLTIGWPAAIFTAVLLVTAGGTAAWWWRSTSAPAGGAVAPPAMTSMPDREATRVDSRDPIEITLSPSAVANAHIETASVTRSPGGDRVQVPGTVNANAYAQTEVNALAAGRVTRVTAELGDRVRQGQVLAEIYSPELAAAETALLSMRAELEAVHQELLRTERLAEIGSASRQELEKIRAEHARYAAETESARTTVMLLGLTAAGVSTLERTGKVDATIQVVAPGAGEITNRRINIGTTVPRDAGLFTVTDLSTVWVIAHVYEQDVARIATGMTSTVSAASLPDGSIDGRVSYIDPQVSTETRTAQVRIEVPNNSAKGRLRLAMYVTVTIATGGAMPSLSVPSSALQQIGAQHVVYLPGSETGRFVERSVEIDGPDASDAGRTRVHGDLSATDRVVTTGSFLLRSERERVGLRAPDGVTTTRMAPAEGVQHREIAVTTDGFAPASVTVERGRPVELVFLRKTDETCAKRVVFPSLQITKDLPLDEPVTIAWTPDEADSVDFICGMNMLKGAVIVK